MHAGLPSLLAPHFLFFGHNLPQLEWKNKDWEDTAVTCWGSWCVMGWDEAPIWSPLLILPGYFLLWSVRPIFHQPQGQNSVGIAELECWETHLWQCRPPTREPRTSISHNRCLIKTCGFKEASSFNEKNRNKHSYRAGPLTLNVKA